MILKLFEYFAAFPARKGVIDSFTNGRSNLPFYNNLLDRIKQLPEAGRLPDIKSYVFGSDLDTVKRRVDAIAGTYLFIDFGDIESDRDARNSITDTFYIAATVAAKVAGTMDIIERAIISDITLTLANRLRAHIAADSAADSSPWLQELSNRQSIIPFISPELQSVGWSILFTSAAADMFNLKLQIRSFLK
jgi:hypothetical protein